MEIQQDLLQKFLQCATVKRYCVKVVYSQSYLICSLILLADFAHSLSEGKFSH